MYRLFLVTLLLVLGSLSVSPASHAQPAADQTVPLPLQTRAADDLLTNTSFEIDTDADGIPDGWTGKKTDLKKADKQKCNKPDKVFANTGECAFEFNGNPDGRASKLQQPLADVRAIANGSKITLMAFVNMKSAAPDTKIADLTINLSDGSKRKLELRLPASPVSGYTQVRKSLKIIIPRSVSVSDAVLTFRYKAQNGTFLVDDVDLNITPLTPLPPSRLLADDGQTKSLFGWDTTLSADGKTAIITTTADNNRQGAAYVFVKTGNTWTQQQKLIPSDSTKRGQFGYSVSLSANGDIALIGAIPGTKSTYDEVREPGSAYVFIRSNGVWTEHQHLTPSGSESGDFFGYSVSLSSDGSIALIGANHISVGGAGNTGAAYVFIRSNNVWIEHQILSASNRAGGDQFGLDVSLSTDGKVAVISAPYKRVGGIKQQGAVYIFVRSKGIWTERQQIFADDGEERDLFGYSVSSSADGNTLLIGAINDKIGEYLFQGSAYIFVRSDNDWKQYQKLVASDNDGYYGLSGFGYSVSLDDNAQTALITAPKDHIGEYPNAIGVGSAYVYVYSDGTWSEQQKLTEVNGTQSDSDQFGWDASLSADGYTALISIYQDNINGNEHQGSAWVFDLR